MHRVINPLSMPERPFNAHSLGQRSESYPSCSHATVTLKKLEAITVMSASDPTVSQFAVREAQHEGTVLIAKVMFDNLSQEDLFGVLSILSLKGRTGGSSWQAIALSTLVNPTQSHRLPRMSKASMLTRS
ncbi:hypothetical protein NliqN6_5078 [Naganishia liquefaciens]|uniref:Uncharacterized protein n=1 Tax=Naganishia liquefaciens TaxID=104408 RepID=A0A8H3YIK5_9TREE|nr:hypothetical protein NliqN6_5078 [Naganishia liquefaciens]